MQPAPITPQDLISIGAVGVVVGFALGMAAHHARAWIRSRRISGLIEKTTLFKFQR